MIRPVIRIVPEALRQLVDHAEAAYPSEACGLLVGNAERLVQRIEPSRNLAAEPRHRFEIDPRLRLTLQRGLRGSGRDVVGLYHSHPDGASHPSASDLEKAWEPALVWLIVAVVGGQAIQVTAHRLAADGAQFEELALRIAPRRPAGEGSV